MSDDVGPARTLACDRQVVARHHRRSGLRLGCTGFGGPPTHIALLRRMCVEERHWIAANEFEDGIAATNLLPGPASTQLAIFCAWRLRGTVGAILGGLCFIVPGLILILGLSAVFLAKHPPTGSSAPRPARARRCPPSRSTPACGLVPASWKRIGSSECERARWIAYAPRWRSGRGHGRPLPRRRPRRSAGSLEIAVRRQVDRVARSVQLFIPAVVGHAAIGRRARIARLGCVQGRRPFLRRGFRHRPAHAARCRHCLPLDDGCPVPQRRRSWPDHTGPCCPDRRGRRLRRARRRRRIARRAGRLHAHRSSSCSSAAHVSIGSGRTRWSNASSPERGPAVIGAIAGSAIPLGLAFEHLWQIPVLAGALLWFRASPWCRERTAHCRGRRSAAGPVGGTRVNPGVGAQLRVTIET